MEENETQIGERERERERRNGKEGSVLFQNLKNDSNAKDPLQIQFLPIYRYK